MRGRSKRVKFLYEIKVNYHHLKVDYNSYKMLYISLKVTTKHKSIVHTQKVNREESKHIITENYQFTKEECNEGITK